LTLDFGGRLSINTAVAASRNRPKSSVDEPYPPRWLAAYVSWLHFSCCLQRVGAGQHQSSSLKIHIERQRNRQSATTDSYSCQTSTACDLHSSQWPTFAACAHHEWHVRDDLSADREALVVSRATAHDRLPSSHLNLYAGVVKPAPRRLEGLHCWCGRPWTAKPAPVLITSINYCGVSNHVTVERPLCPP